MIRVLIADPSASEAEKLGQLLESDPAIKVVGMTQHGQEVLPMLERRRPGVLLLDLYLTRPSAMELIQEVMGHRPIPILVLASAGATAADDLPFRAIQTGALEIVDKSPILYALHNQEAAARLIRLIKVVADVHVVPRARRVSTSPTQRSLGYLHRGERVQIVAVGASTGGPQALLEIFGHLKPEFPVPIVLVQHMGSEFISHLVDWLNHELKIPVQLARHGDTLRPATVTIAPGGYHLTVGPRAVVQLSDGRPINSCIPSIDVLFQSAAEVYGPAALGILLTGMGEDGARGLQAIRQVGGKTIAQDEGSSIIFGMPKAAIELEAADLVLPLAQIGKVLAGLSAFPGPVS